MTDSRKKLFIKTVLLLVVVIGLGLIILPYLQKHFSNDLIVKEIDEGPNIFSSDAGYQDLEQDTDQDGLVDWKEVLWGLDPNDRDTGDTGELDSVKVESSQHKSSLSADTTNGNTDIVDEDLPAHIVFTHNLITTLLKMQQAGTLNEESLQELINETGNYVDKYEIVRKQYSRDDIHVVTGTQENILGYFDNVDDIFTRNRVLSYDPLAPLYYITEQVDRSEFEAAEGRLNATLDLLLGMSVPNSVASDHVYLCNTLATLLIFFEEVETTNIGSLDNTDPFSMIANISNFQKIILEFARTGLRYEQLHELARDDASWR